MADIPDNTAALDAALAILHAPTAPPPTPVPASGPDRLPGERLAILEAKTGGPR